MSSERRTALLAGVFFLITFLHIPVVFLEEPVLDSARYILTGGEDTRVYAGAFLEVLFLIANAATAIVLFSILKRQSESLSLGYVAVRIFESTIIGVGLASLLALLILRQDVGGVGAADGESLVVAGRSLVALHDATFLLGPAFCAAFGNGILLGYLMYKSELVPRKLAIIGLIGGPLAFLAATLALFNVVELGEGANAILTIPEIVWELSLGLYLAFKGFSSRSPLLRPSAAPAA